MERPKLKLPPFFGTRKKGNGEPGLWMVVECENGKAKTELPINQTDVGTCFTRSAPEPQP
jgi:hypothetical protein